MTVGSRGEGLIAGRVAPYPSSFECPALVSIIQLAAKIGFSGSLRHQCSTFIEEFLDVGLNKAFAVDHKEAA